MSDMLAEAARGQRRKPLVPAIGPAAGPKQVKEIVSVKSDIESAIPRDQWDRPKILQPDGTLKSYRRASTVAEALEDHFGLNKWMRRLAAEGLSERPDLVAAVAMAKADGNKREIDRLIEEALDYAGANVASRNGTTMHRLTERLDKGLPLPKGLPANIRAMLRLYKQVFLARFEVLDTERFVVQDKIEVAGTYDKLLKDKTDGKIYIGDTKTGQSLDHMALKTCAQVSVYASGQHYDLDGEREPHGAERNRGVLIWLPWTDDVEEQPAECEIRWLDLTIGRKAIMEAVRVDSFRKLKPAQILPRIRE